MLLVFMRTIRSFFGGKFPEVLRAVVREDSRQIGGAAVIIVAGGVTADAVREFPPIARVQLPCLAHHANEVAQVRAMVPELPGDFVD